MSALQMCMLSIIPDNLMFNELLPLAVTILFAFNKIIQPIVEDVLK